MKVLITGGSKDFGKNILELFGPKSKSVSRSNGYNLLEPTTRSKVAKMSLEFDIFINYANPGKFSQVLLLSEVFDLWKETKKKGLITNIGSYSTYSPSKDIRLWTIEKFALDYFSRQVSKFSENSLAPFRVTNIRLGMLDLPKSRSKSNWQGHGHMPSDLANFVKFIYNCPDYLLAPEITINTRLTN